MTRRQKQTLLFLIWMWILLLGAISEPHHLRGAAAQKEILR